MQFACTEDYRGCPLLRLMSMLYLFVRSSEPRFARWNEFDLKRGIREIPIPARRWMVRSFPQEVQR